MNEPITKVINGVETVAYMGTSDCFVRTTKAELIECLGMDCSDCICPGAVPRQIRGRGIWVEKQRYLELRLLGELP